MARVGWESGKTAGIDGRLSELGDTATLDAKGFREAVRVWLERDGWTASWGGARDIIVAARGDERIGIRCDRKTPRERSLHELRHFDGTGALVLVREERTPVAVTQVPGPKRRPNGPKHELRGRRVTLELLDAGRSLNGGWSRKQLAALGVAWLLVKGWRDSVLGRLVSEDEIRRFLAARG